MAWSSNSIKPEKGLSPESRNCKERGRTASDTICYNYQGIAEKRSELSLLFSIRDRIWQTDRKWECQFIGWFLYVSWEWARWTLLSFSLWLLILISRWIHMISKIELFSANSFTASNINQQPLSWKENLLLPVICSDLVIGPRKYRFVPKANTGGKVRDYHSEPPSLFYWMYV